MNRSACVRGLVCLLAAAQSVACQSGTAHTASSSSSSGSAASTHSAATSASTSAATSSGSTSRGTASTGAGSSGTASSGTGSSGTSSGGSGSACEAIAAFRTTSATTTGIALAWAGAAGTTATLSRKTYCGTDGYVTLATLPAGTTSYTDSDIHPDWVYWYELTAADGQGHSASVVIGAAASASETPGCSGGEAPQPSGVVDSCPSASTGSSSSSSSNSSTSSSVSASTSSSGVSSSSSGSTASASTSSTGATSSSSSGTIVPAFYVATDGLDSNDGSLAAPFATLGAAQMAMEASSTIKTTYLRAGSYTLPTIDCGGSTCGLQLDSADDGETWSYYPPDGVDSADLSGASTSASNGLVTAIGVAGSNITLNGLSIHDFSYAGIGSSGGADALLVENCVLFNGYDATNSSNPGAISLYGAGNTTISHNVIHDIAMFGVSVSNVNGDISNLLVTGNVVYNTCTANADCGALYVQDVTTTATNLQFTNNYLHDGNTFAGLGSNSGSAIYADDCTSNVIETGNVITGRNGSNTLMIHGGSNVQQNGNLTDLATFGQHAAVYQTSGVSACASAVMSGNQYENNLVIGAGGGGGFGLLSGSPQNTPTIVNNDFYSYGTTPISSGNGSYADTSPVSVDPQLSGWTYTLASGSPVFGTPVNFPPLVGGWGPPGYVLPETGTPPTSPH